MDVSRDCFLSSLTLVISEDDRYPTAITLDSCWHVIVIVTCKVWINYLTKHTFPDLNVFPFNQHYGFWREFRVALTQKLQKRDTAMLHSTQRE